MSAFHIQLFLSISFACNHWNQSELAIIMWCSILMSEKCLKELYKWGQLKTPGTLLRKMMYTGIGWWCWGSLARTVDLPGHGRSRDIQQHQSSFHTRTGTWRICKVCPGTPDGTTRKAWVRSSPSKVTDFHNKGDRRFFWIYSNMFQILLLVLALVSVIKATRRT